MIASIAAVAFAVNIITSCLKNYIYPKFGKFGVQVTAFVLAAIGAVYVTYSPQLPSLVHFVEAAGAIFSLSVAFYEVVLSRISWFKGKAA